MITKKLYILFLLLIVLNSCELIRIGEIKKAPKVIDLNQKQALNTVFLFKAELDSNNPKAATQLITYPDSKIPLATERYEHLFDAKLLQRKIYNRPITNYKIDTLNSTNHKVSIEFDYRLNYNFNVIEINGLWFITSYQRF